jgi:hypothetical protein
MPAAQIYPFGEGFAPADIGAFHAVGANFAGVMTLLGYSQANTAQAGGSFQIVLYWQVGDRPMPMPAPTRGSPLAAFVHLTAPGDAQAKLAQFDGWPTALRGLEPGDIIAQTVELAIPPDTPAGVYDLLAGLYSPQTFARLTVEDGSGADSVQVDQVEIE